MYKCGLNAESQKPITVYYKNEIVGVFIVNIIVNDMIILELKFEKVCKTNY